MEQEKNNCQERRIGSVTFGITLICYGILFLVRIFVPTIRYQLIFQCWPVVFILLGAEILVENHKCRTEQRKIVYDYAAVAMLVVMLIFAMVMAVIDYSMSYGGVMYW